MTNSIQRKLLLVAVLVSCGISVTRADTAKVDFVKDIAPIFQESCVSCHGPEKHKGDLRLDSKDAAFKGGKDGQVIAPEHADKSDLYRRIILPEGSDDVMPSKGTLLTKKQTDLIKDWINQGAVWPEGAIAKSEEAPAASPNDIFAALTPVKPAASETGAIAKLGASGIDVRPVAMNLSWRAASFRSLGSSANDAAIAPLKDILSLVDLNLGGTKITDAGLQNLAGLTNLITLHLELTGITDKGLAQLKRLDHLAYLNLYGTSVTDKGLEELKGLRSLKHLYLWQTKVTAEGAADLQKAVPGVMISRGWENEPAQKVETKEMDKKDAAPAEKKEAKK
jgi:mono/diheme cytochrome c family protein